jgi:hypothetical protein
MSCNIADKPIPQEVVDRFGISGFRTEKFANDDEDSSQVDQFCDLPIMHAVLDRIHDAAMSVQKK